MSDMKRKLSVKEVLLYLAIGIGGIIVLANLTSTPTAPPATSVQQPKPVPPMSEADFKKTAKEITFDENKDIYYKEFLKNPVKYRGTKLAVTGKIMHIEEENGETVMQVYISRNYDTIIVYYPGTLKIYQDDLIKIYGEGAGTFEGQNRMGAAMSWPVIRASYIDKKKLAY